MNLVILKPGKGTPLLSPYKNERMFEALSHLCMAGLQRYKARTRNTKTTSPLPLPVGYHDHLDVGVTAFEFNIIKGISFK
ncbi:hypothetical protein TNCV_4920031 [Trichonephila clavipes]|nr:hypothetical protein TNCV_4920031 [Trichonephila clavipes]